MLLQYIVIFEHYICLASTCFRMSYKSSFGGTSKECSLSVMPSSHHSTPSTCTKWECCSSCSTTPRTSKHSTKLLVGPDFTWTATCSLRRSPLPCSTEATVNTWDCQRSMRSTLTISSIQAWYKKHNTWRCLKVAIPLYFTV